jgi:serine/threonine protein kinase
MLVHVQIDYMSEHDARWIFQQLIIAVDYCHRLGIANRDIKVRACACSITRIRACASASTQQLL